jgi:hypothetical protein
VGSKLLVKALMAPLSCQIEVYIPKGGQKSIRGIAFPVLSIGEGEPKPIRQREASIRDEGRKETTWMTFYHGHRFSPFDEQVCSRCIGMESANHEAFFAFHSIRVDPKNAMWVWMLDPDQPFDVF